MVHLVQQRLQGVVSVTAIWAAVDGHVELARLLRFRVGVKGPCHVSDATSLDAHTCAQVAFRHGAAIFFEKVIWKPRLALPPCDPPMPPRAGPLPLMGIQLIVAQPAVERTGAHCLHWRSDDLHVGLFPHPTSGSQLHGSQVAVRGGIVAVIFGMSAGTGRELYHSALHHAASGGGSEEYGEVLAGCFGSTSH